MDIKIGMIIFMKIEVDDYKKGRIFMLNINSITKVYSNGRGIKKFSLEADKGEVLAFIGPNGSGKSTALKIMAGVMSCDEGTVAINNIDTKEREAKKYIGYLPEEIFVYEKMSIYELLNFTAAVKFNKNLSDEIDESLKKYDLWDYRHQIIKNLSMGMKKKVGIIGAFLGSPELIILDEPTNGLDTKGIITLKEKINYLKEKGSIIIISSHMLDFVGNIKCRAIFLKDGNVVEDIKEGSNVNLENIYSKLYL